MLYKLSWMCFAKSQYIWKNYLHCWFHKVSVFQHGIYHQFFLMPKKWLQMSCAENNICLIFQILFCFVDVNVFFTMTDVVCCTVLPGYKKNPSL